MATIKSPDDLIKIKAAVQSKHALRQTFGHPDQLVQIRVAMATCGIASGAKTVMDYFITELNIPYIQFE